MRSAILTSVILLAAGLWTAASAGQSDLPEGKGKATLQRICVGCHELDAVTASRYTQMGWKQTVDDMVSRGAEGSPDDINDIVAYLTKYFGKLNVNTASQAQLQDFLGLPEKDAQAILAYRAQNGNIKNLDQLKSIPGVNAQKLQEKSALIAFSQ